MKYQTFKELYNENELLIDEEFEKREQFRYNELMTAIENTVKNLEGAAWSAAFANDYKLCEAYMEEKDCWKAMKDRVRKEMYELKYHGPISENDTHTFRKRKDKLVDMIVFPGGQEKYRGRQDYMNRIEIARNVASFVEDFTDEVYELGFHYGVISTEIKNSER